MQAQTWSFITRVIGRRWRKRCQEVSDVTETLQSLPGCSVADGEPDTSREAVAVIGRLCKRRRKRTNTSPLGRAALGGAAGSLPQREQSEVAEKCATTRSQKLLLDLGSWRLLAALTSGVCGLAGAEAPLAGLKSR